MAYKVLNSKIPFGAFGRNLTSSECKALRKHGVTCSEKYLVNRRYDSPSYGYLWSPNPRGGYDNTDIILETMD